MGKQLWKPGNMLYPLPVVMVSVAEKQTGEDGGQKEWNKLRKSNILTVAWTGTVCTNPPMVSISVRPERYSYGMLRDSGEFVLNLTTKALVYAADYCGVKSGRDVDKWRELNLTPLPAAKIGAPLIAESPVNIECRVERVLELGSHHMFVANVEAVHAQEEYLDENGRFDLQKADPAVYSHGIYYNLGEALGSFGFSVKKDAKTKKQKKH